MLPTDYNPGSAGHHNPEEVQSNSLTNKFALKLNIMQKTPPEEGDSSKGCAIRVEKQASFNTKSPDDSSCSGGAQSSPPYEERLSEHYGATSAFAAAESKVRDSLIQILNRNADIANNFGSSSDDDTVKSYELAESDGPPTIEATSPQHNQFNQMINEVVLSPRLEENKEHSFMLVGDCFEEKRQINFL